MQREGFESVLQLDGGILKYFEECGGEHYEGECFVFDQRVGLDPSLHETGSSQCFACQTPLTAAEQATRALRAGKILPVLLQDIRRAPGRQHRAPPRADRPSHRPCNRAASPMITTGR